MPTPPRHALWFAPLQVLAALIMLAAEVGWSLLAGVALVLAMLSARQRAERGLLALRRHRPTRPPAGCWGLSPLLRTGQLGGLPRPPALD